MSLIVGLGNPGKKYQKTRHNIGFRVLDKFVKENNFPGFRISKKFNSLISEGFLNNEKVILAKPRTFMNLSGKMVKALINFYKTTRTSLVVIHDDIDLPLGKIKISKGRGAAGHKGVQSIINAIGSKNFIRFRVGIYAGSQKPKNIEKFVLQKFEGDEEKIVKDVIERTVKAIEFTLIEGVEKTMSQYNN